ncbi:alpha/beta fold hydrolase [Nocardioides acrostichi]|uniref:Alpha/beta fold hydrolase n=1 Tax=Nocardioides acrostichi TaxID=2784339 RepID=A0A930V1H0_9ACTN|nr:alpha/beta fold hydrolase [Nocardioides acrostichi]MBF4162000.1 alpha/beta fold hydrolase [Nocardioides acrostichi]
MRLHTTHVGDSGAPVVFLHGLFGQGRNFTQIAKALVPGAASTLVDLPDHGRSAWTDEVDYARYADLVADRLAEQGDLPAHVVGHSMGGKVAMVLALRHADLVERLVVVDIAPAPSEGAGDFEHLLDSLARIDLTRLERRSDADEQLAQWVDDERVRGFLLQNLRAGPDGWAWQANLELLRRDLGVIGGWPDELEGLEFDHPVLWVAGEHSPYIGPEHEPAMRALFPRTTQVTIKGAGHWVHSEQPEAFVSALRVFLGVGAAR